MDVPVTGPMLQSKAKEIAQRLQIENFQASNGSFESFRARHNINFRSLSDESAEEDLEAAEDWKSKLNQVVSEYPPENQFNAHETG
jgi:LPS O-antigen subunit length determinant protein (WzzB/FepE family)